MKNAKLVSFIIFLQLSIFTMHDLHSQVTPIINYAVNVNGQVQLEVNSTTSNYYILKTRLSLDSSFSNATSMTLGEPGTTIITEPLRNYSQDHYQVLEYSINTPFDTDEDGIDDITEFNQMPVQNPINAATPISFQDGLVGINSFSKFSELAVQYESVQWSSYLNGKEFMKFIILDFNTSHPKIYFINTNTHSLHVDFATLMSINHLGPNLEKGQITYHPTVMSANGTLGTFAFNYTNNENKSFLTVQKTQELLAANMPFISNNLSYFINSGNETAYNDELSLFQSSRVSVVFESDVYAGINYWGLNQTEGYGYFRIASLGEIPGSKDIVLYQSLPNSLPRVGGVITSVIQTPLSHVNLRAIQNNIPNAFIRNPLTIDSLAGLVNHYIYFNVEQSHFTIREASLEEVNNWYDSIRPTSSQIPPLNLDYTTIEPLDHITFNMYDGYGAKVSNVATMRTFDFPDNTIPNGFGIPFYFYQEFMIYNHLFDDAKSMMSDPNFVSNRQVRNTLLNDFREKIINSTMPNWMMDQLYDMQNSFPAGTSIRCRSSTNNEDLPGFSGAGLYDSKTQHPHEGHIAKSIKQVYSSLWNLRAFEEREFYRINHFYTSMGILCHPNYTNEKVNGVGVSTDPIYNTSNSYYLNSQVDEELITNPNGSSKPEELLLNSLENEDDPYLVIQYSSHLETDSLLMSKQQLSDLRLYLSIIHDEFEKLYHAEGNSTFAMDIEYKITNNDQLIIKQARPWVSFEPEVLTQSISTEHCDLSVYPNPAVNFINVNCDDCNLTTLKIYDLNGKLVLEKNISNLTGTNNHVSVQNLAPGVYILNAFINDGLCASKKIIVN